MSATHESTDGHHEDHGGTSTYIAVAIALVFLTACSYWTYTSFWPFGESIAIKRLWMMAVSCTKAMLVILFFMHLKWEANWKWVLTVPMIIMSALLMLALVPDVGMRMRYASQERMIYAAERPALETSDDAQEGNQELKVVNPDEDAATE
ncbi:MAG: cytochrome C oxidase subunit IV family protein [Lacipirellulaceae bacterium]